LTSLYYARLALLVALIAAVAVLAWIAVAQIRKKE
jgi:hypothetical protein